MAGIPKLHRVCCDSSTFISVHTVSGKVVLYAEVLTTAFIFLYLSLV